jgi:hypothetical protein
LSETGIAGENEVQVDVVDPKLADIKVFEVVVRSQKLSENLRAIC